MKEEDKELIKKEDEKEIKRMHRVGVNSRIVRHKIRKRLEELNKNVTENIKRLQEELEKPQLVKILGKIPVETDIEFPETQKVKGKVEAKVKFPDVQEIIGKVIARVKFPEVQKIVGEVIAKVKFPEVQKIKGDVTAKVDFPETQKIKGSVVTDIPKLKLDKLEVVPIVFFDGKKIINPGLMSQSVSGDGKLFAAIKELSGLSRTQSVFYSDQVKAVASGVAIALGSSTDIKTLVIQALKDNRETLHITAGDSQDYELQPGQPVTVIIDNLKKIKMISSYPGDGVCYIAS